MTTMTHGYNGIANYERRVISEYTIYIPFVPDLDRTQSHQRTRHHVMVSRIHVS